MCWEAGIVSQRQTMLASAVYPAHRLLPAFFLSFFTRSFVGRDAFLFVALFCFAEGGTYSVAQAGLKPKVILLPWSPESWVHGCTLPACLYLTCSWGQHTREEAVAASEARGSLRLLSSGHR